MGSSSSRHSGDSERRDRGEYPHARRHSSGSVYTVGSPGESQPRRESQRRTRSAFRSARQPEVQSSQYPAASSSRSGNTTKLSSSASSSLGCPVTDQPHPPAPSSSSSNPNTQPARNGTDNASISRTVETVGTGALFVVETFPSDTARSGSHGRTEGAQSLRNSLWLEGHSPWNSRLDTSLSGSSDPPSSNGLSETSRQSLQAVCETTLQHHRVNEMQERLRRYAGLPPPSYDLHELERRPSFSAESSYSSDYRQGNSFGSSDGVSSPFRFERDEYPFRSTPASLQAWEITEEGRLIEYRHSVYSESWDRHLALNRGEPQSETSDRVSSVVGSNNSSATISPTGRESRRNGGRRLWDALTRAASHRRSSTNANSPSTESVIESWMQSDDDHMYLGGFHSRGLDSEERRRRVRSQVWALQLLSTGLDGMPGFTRQCTSGHHHGRCSCDVHGSTAEDTSTRASISRIIMLAEALFEVLDEIHRQSIALSRTSSPIASLPAPDTIVNAIPTRKISKKLRDEATQCNICLVEYEEGDHVRVLPCHHEYHVACVDKWLKEVHRVCPLCRGNVCEVNPVTFPA